MAKFGNIISADLTSESADELKNFYGVVIGWQFSEVAMGNETHKYNDYSALDSDGAQVGGVCHKRGFNSDQPGGWMVYFNVENVRNSIDACEKSGGAIVKQVSGEDGTPVFAVLKDPEGNNFAVISQPD